MKKCLAWDSSDHIGSVVAFEASEQKPASLRRVAEFSLNVQTSTHSEHLLWAIEQTRKAARWEIEEIDFFGVGVGPGSFTGLRIGVTTARSLAHALKKPLIGVSSLEVLLKAASRPYFLSLQSKSNQPEPLVVVAQDACKGEVFASWAKPSELFEQRASTKELVLTCSELVSLLHQELKPSTPIRIEGNARQRYPSFFESLSKHEMILENSSFITTNSLIGQELIHAVWQENLRGNLRNPLDVSPHYLRASDAEVKLKKGLLKKAPLPPGGNSETNDG